MRGERQGSQERLFYEFCLEDRVPAGHLPRKIEAVLDRSRLRVSLAAFYGHTGCPSVDPEPIIRMMLIGYRYSIRSDRRLCQEVEMNLAYRWFCGLGLEDKVPDHSTFSVDRHGRSGNTSPRSMARMRRSTPSVRPRRCRRPIPRRRGRRGDVTRCCSVTARTI